jgi:hypothetical protein
MPVSGVGNSGVIRTEQVRSEKRAEENVRSDEQKQKVQDDQKTKEAREQPQDTGRGENVDMTA